MNKIHILLVFLLIELCSQNLWAQKLTFTLEDVIQRAKNQSPKSAQARTRKKNEYWKYEIFKSSLNPQLALRGSAPGYAKAFDRVVQNDGAISFRPINQISSSVNLGLDQPLSCTGGEVSINSNLSYFNRLNDDDTDQLWRGSTINIGLRQPLFAFNDLKWSKKTEPLRYEGSKREYVQEMEDISRTAVSRYFNYMNAQIDLQIAVFNEANNDTIYRIAQGRYNIGKTSRDELLQVELQLLRSQQSVAEAKIGLETAQLELKSYLGLNDDRALDLKLPEEIPEFSIDVEEALGYGKDNSASYIAFQRRRLEAEREVARAKGRRFETTLNVTYGLNNSGVMLDDVYSSQLNEQRLNIGFGIPILTWGRNEARLQTAIANQELQDYVITQEEQNLEQSILTQVRRFDLLRTQLAITQKSDEVAYERYVVSQNRYLIGKISITNLNIALTEKDAAKRSYIKALRDFWVSYYNLRSLTLYDFHYQRSLY